MRRSSISGFTAYGIFRHAMDAQPAVHVQANTELLDARDEPAGVSVKVRIGSTGETEISVYDCVILATGLDDENHIGIVGHWTGAQAPACKRIKIETDTLSTWDGPLTA